MFWESIPNESKEFGSSVIYRHFCRYLPNFCHSNCSDNIVFRRGYHLCFVVRFLCDGMIYFSWGLINGFSSKVAFTINNEMPRKKFFCFDLGWRIIRCCPSFSDWNKVCIDVVHLQNWTIQRFFFCPSVLDNTRVLLYKSSLHCFSFLLNIAANWN